MNANSPSDLTAEERAAIRKARESARYTTLYQICMVADAKTSREDLLKFMQEDGDLTAYERDTLSKRSYQDAHVLKIRCDLQARQSLLSEMKSNGNAGDKSAKQRRAKIDLKFQP